MSEAIRSISLDDIGDIPDKNERAGIDATGLAYRPKAGDDFKSRTPASNSGSQFNTLTNMQGLSEDRGTIFGTAMSRMTGLMGGRFEGQNRARYFVVFGGLILALALALFLTVGGSEQSPLLAIQSMADSLFGGDTASTESDASLVDNPPPVASKIETPPSPSPPAVAVKDAMLANPYWSIPNPLLLATELGPLGNLTGSQEQRWRQGLAHPFTWQRARTVGDMRRARLKGSQYLLLDALAQPKFWTRMEAAIALTELGEALDVDTVETALGNAPRALVENYFRRFSQSYSEGELYLMRQAIRLVNAGARLVILQNLTQHRDPINDLYLVAAGYDSNDKIKVWIEQELRQKPVNSLAKEQFQQIIAGATTAPLSTPDLAKPSGEAATELKAVPENVNVEDVYFLKDEEKPLEQKIAPPVDDGFKQLEMIPPSKP